MNSLYSELFTVDYGINRCSEKPMIDLSFTYLDWKMAETLSKKEKNFKIQKVTDSGIL